MADKEKLLRELEKKFQETKLALGFKSNLDEIDKYFFIKDLVLEKGFVSEDFSNQLRSRIMDVMISWDNYLHSLIMPNPQNLFNLNESKAFNESEKKEIMAMMSRIAYFAASNGLARLTRDKKHEIKVINDSLKFWKETYVPFFIKIMEKIEKTWKKE